MNKKEMNFLRAELTEMKEHILENTKEMIKMRTRMETTFSFAKWAAGGIALIVTAIVNIFWR